MGDETQPSKKRCAGRELSRDNPGLDDDEDLGEQEMGTFKKASEDVLATRRIVKVRRQVASTAPSVPSSNPFAGIRLVTPAPSSTPAPVITPAVAQVANDKVADEDSETKDDATTEPNLEDKPAELATESGLEDSSASVKREPKVHQPDEAPTDVTQSAAETKPVAEEDAGGSVEKTAEVQPVDEKQKEGVKAESNDERGNGNSDDYSDAKLNSFQQLSSSQNAFTGLAGTGFSSSSFSFGSFQKDGSPSQSSLPAFSFAASSNGSTPLFGAAGTSIGSKTENAFGSMPEGPRETGEENEETVFSADSVLFEFYEGGWKERGKGEVKVNVVKDESKKARLVMRAKGNLRLILNARLYADMKLAKMDKKGITFACVNIANEGKDSLSTFALKFKDVSMVEQFSSTVSSHKDKPAVSLKTPENSPKASDD